VNRLFTVLTRRPPAGKMPCADDATINMHHESIVGMTRSAIIYL
jgi:hypothetical protein